MNIEERIKCKCTLCSGSAGHWWQQEPIEQLRRQQEQMGQYYRSDPAPTTEPAPPPEPEPILPPPPEPQEVTPIPVIKRRKCYVCGSEPAVARAKDEPAFCEEHRSKR